MTLQILNLLKNHELEALDMVFHADTAPKAAGDNEDPVDCTASLVASYRALLQILPNLMYARELKASMRMRVDSGCRVNGLVDVAQLTLLLNL